MKSPFTITYNPDGRKPRTIFDTLDPTQTTTEDVEAELTAQAVPILLESDQDVRRAEDPDRAERAPAPVLEIVEPPTTTEASIEVTSATAFSRKRSKMNVTWDDERKLRKKGHPTGLPPVEGAPPTPDPTPERPKSSFFSRFTGAGKNSTTYPSSDQVKVPPSPPPSPGWKHHDSYFPEYTPIYPTTTFADPFAQPYLLTPAEMQAQEHAARVGHAVAVHYPMLPPFSEYQSAGGKTQGAWQSGHWGNSNWTGFGLNGERLPDGEGKTFGAPMPKGVLPEGAKGAGGGGAKKGKGGDGAGAGAGSAAGADGEQAQDAEQGGGAEGEAEAAPAEGGGGGGGGKKKKKK